MALRKLQLVLALLLCITAHHQADAQFSWTSWFKWPAPAPNPAPTPAPVTYPAVPVVQPAPVPVVQPAPVPNPNVFTPVRAPVPLGSLNQVLKWKPKTADTYKPELVDWAGVYSACRATVAFEKRIGNFWIRAAFHDGMSVDVTQCVNGAGCGGLDASNMLTLEEMTRPENAYDNFTAVAARASIKIATWYDCSMADVLALCGAAAVEAHSNDRFRILGRPDAPFRVGRVDRNKPTPPGLLPPADATITAFINFFHDRNFTSVEGAALLGSHSLIDDQGCDMGRNMGRCKPSGPGTCANVRMFQWDNHYYQDICTPSIEVKPRDPNDPADLPVSQLPKADFEILKADETCKFTSEKFRKRSLDEVMKARAGKGRIAADAPTPFSVDWSPCYDQYNPATCSAVKVKWPYTVNDAFLGQTCYSQEDFSSEQPKFEMQNAMRAWSQGLAGQDAWDAVFAPTYVKMVSYFALWPTTGPAFYTNGRECASAWMPDTKCLSSNKLSIFTVSCSNCSEDGKGCHSCCRCGSSFLSGASKRPKPIKNLYKLLTTKIRL